MKRAELIAAATEFLAHPRFVTAFTSVSVATGVFAFALRQLIGMAGLIAIIAALLALAASSAFARRESIPWRGLLPISLIVFVAWAAVSLFWSSYRWATMGGLAYLACFTLLGLYVALMRDTIQIVRAYGDVLRFALLVSIALEIIAGVLIDAPIRFLAIDGNLDALGPIQGISGARNQLGILTVIALITFLTEFRTKSVERGMAIGSLVLAGIALLLTRSPVGLGAIIVVTIAAGALYGLRRVAPERRRFWQFGLLGAALVASGVAWAVRSTIVAALNAGGELSYRLEVWRQAWALVSINPLEGWGWIGRWRDDIAPFVLFEPIGARPTTSAVNAYLDVWLQLGLVGFAIFIGVVGLALVRSWLLASRRRSFVFTWPALILVTLVTTALAESSMLVEVGWLTFVVCAVKAADELSWRQAFARLPQN